MKIFIQEPPDDQPLRFGGTDDVFKRGHIAAGMTHLVTTVDQAIVCLVDGPWGSGKSTFLRMWKTELEEMGVPVVFFDAFANDFHNDAFIALSGEILAVAKPAEGEPSPKVKRFKDEAV